MSRQVYAAMCLLLGAVVGCGGGESVEAPRSEPASAIPAPAPELPNVEVTPAVGDLETSPAPTSASLEAETEEPTPVAPKKVAVEDYKPPFPNRGDLFSLPKFAGGRISGDKQESSNSVVLLGFATLDEPKVILEINGMIKSLEDGEEKLGVRVISISPPSAVLQRGRTRWTASIE